MQDLRTVFFHTPSDFKVVGETRPLSVLQRVFARARSAFSLVKIGLSVSGRPGACLSVEGSVDVGLQTKLEGARNWGKP